MGKLATFVGATVGAIAASAAMVVPAQAVTIGTALNVPPATGEGCEVIVLPGLRQLGAPVPPSCTFFAPNTQTPPGNYVVTTGRIRTGPRTGPMVFTAVEALRSKATSADGTPGGVICCVASGESQVFTPPPNSVVEVPINLPVKNTTELIDGEQIEVINYLGITLLDLRSSAPLGNFSTPATSFFAPALRAGRQDLMNGLGYSVIPLINGEFTACAGASAAGPTAATSSGGPDAPGRGASKGAGASRVAGCPGFRPGGGGGAGGPGGPSPASGSPADSGSAGFKLARRIKLVRGGRVARLVATVPRAGVLRVRPTARFRKLVTKASRRVKAGRNALVARLTKRGRRAFARRGRLRLTVVITYRARGGKPTSKRRAIVFRAANGS